MKFVMMLCAAVMLYTGDVSANVFARDVSLPTSQLAQPGMWDIGAIGDEIRLEKDGWEITEDPSVAVSQEVSNKKKKSKLKKAIWAAAGIAAFGTGVALFTSVYAPGVASIGIYEGLKFLSVGTFKAIGLAGVTTSLIADFAGISSAIATAAMCASTRCFYKVVNS